MHYVTMTMHNAYQAQAARAQVRLICNPFVLLLSRLQVHQLDLSEEPALHLAFAFVVVPESKERERPETRFGAQYIVVDTALRQLLQTFNIDIASNSCLQSSYYTVHDITMF